MFTPKISKIVNLIDKTTEYLADIVDLSIKKAQDEIKDFILKINYFEEKIKSLKQKTELLNQHILKAKIISEKLRGLFDESK